MPRVGTERPGALVLKEDDIPRKGGNTDRHNRRKHNGHRVHRKSRSQRRQRALSKKWWARG